MSQQIMNLVEKACMKKEKPSFEIGDTVNVHCRIIEGDKERIQVFTGVVIAMSGSGSREMFTVRRIVQGEGVERKFPLHSPKVAKVEVVRSAKVRRAKLFFLRDRVGKATRLEERRVTVKKTADAAEVKAPKKLRGRAKSKAAKAEKETKEA
ncbi:MAG: 50S ribosomal protein L19 [Planctomycetia bacterium]|nr:50S ribosomal protein L19 [Planctomycetia bacterium]